MGHEAAAPQAPPEHTALMEAINTCKTALTEKMDHVYTELGLIRRDIYAFRSSVTEVEQRVSSTEDVQREHAADLHSLKIRVKHLEAEDAENLNRLNNLHILGLPEGAEGNDTTLFTQQLLRSPMPPSRPILWWSMPIRSPWLGGHRGHPRTCLYLNC